jgi:hypothetical protein
MRIIREERGGKQTRRKHCWEKEENADFPFIGSYEAETVLGEGEEEIKVSIFPNSETFQTNIFENKCKMKARDGTACRHYSSSPKTRYKFVCSGEDICKFTSHASRWRGPVRDAEALMCARSQLTGMGWPTFRSYCPS